MGGGMQHEWGIRGTRIDCGWVSQNEGGHEKVQNVGGSIILGRIL
jgi:hypothetical protein